MWQLPLEKAKIVRLFNSTYYLFFLYLKMKRRRIPVVDATCAQNKNGLYLLIIDIFIPRLSKYLGYPHEKYVNFPSLRSKGPFCSNISFSSTKQKTITILLPHLMYKHRAQRINMIRVLRLAYIGQNCKNNTYIKHS